MNVLFDISVDPDFPWWQYLLNGLGISLALVACAFVIAILVGSVVGVMRTTRNPWMRRFSIYYVFVFRNIPLLVQFFLWFYVVPGLSESIKHLVLAVGPDVSQFAAAVLCLGIYTSARIAEDVRSGIEAIEGGQRQAAYAVGLREFGVYRHVLLPVAYRIIIPQLTSEATSLVKNSSVAYSIGLAELFSRTLTMGELTFRYTTAFLASAVGYVSVTLVLTALMILLERRFRLLSSLSGGAHS
ncbi:amino acid ABC transporter permease [Candidimonas nitroreducens]|uniref:Glutamate ABC transporter permease n=1 Tax=Candidimonas nitroreducens TaxID=683354 RepID=A0A225MKJ2_9BURK|nr:amino acid ABC transporter permease [Candidimonas nitroreducens]OWT61897.1 glutamate ABC transporter permease [Candidimonas nitroreducens]